MADFSTLIASIEATIKQNGVQAITGQVLQDELLLMVSAINQLKQDTLEGYAFYGEALPNGATRVVTQNTFFLAGAGSYTINGNAVTISDSGISVIVYDCVNDDITTYQLFAYDANPTSGSANAVTSGGVKSALDTKADKNGASPDLFAGFAGNLVDTRSAGTHQGPFAFRQSGGDGVNYMRKILGRTEAWNQLVDDFNTDTQDGVTLSKNADGTYKVNGTLSSDYTIFSGTTRVVLVVGHKYLLSGIKENMSFGASSTSGVELTSATPQIKTCVLGGTSSIALVLNGGVGTSFNNVIISPKIFDLTLMYGAGNEPSTVAEFEALHPLPYYNYNAGVLKNNAATRLETTGFNQWDEEWGKDGYSLNCINSMNPIPAFPNTEYAVACPNLITVYEFTNEGINTASHVLSNGDTFVSLANTAFFQFFVEAAYGTTYNHDICINISDPSRNGIYEPYWKREIVLGLTGVTGIPEGGTEADRVTIFPDGMAGVGTAQDMFYEENGVAKARGTMALKIDLGGLSSWSYGEYGGVNYFQCPVSGLKAAGATSVANLICTRYTPRAAATSAGSSNGIATLDSGGTTYIRIFDSSMSSADIVDGVIAKLSGVELLAEAATPVVYTDLQNADGTPFVFPKMIEVDNLGTEKRLPEDTADNPQAPFECDSNYSISTANLVRKLSE